MLCNICNGMLIPLRSPLSSVWICIVHDGFRSLWIGPSNFDCPSTRLLFILQHAYFRQLSGSTHIRTDTLNWMCFLQAISLLYWIMFIARNIGPETAKRNGHMMKKNSHCMVGIRVEDFWLFVRLLRKIKCKEFLLMSALSLLAILFWFTSTI